MTGRRKHKPRKLDRDPRDVPAAGKDWPGDSWARPAEHQQQDDSAGAARPVERTNQGGGGR